MSLLHYPREFITLRSMNYKVVIFLSILVSLPPWSVQAETETVYISDTLRVGVRPEPDSRAIPIGVVMTGMELEVLERQDNFIRIRTEKGLTGWIKDIYILEEPPAIIQLKQLRVRQANVSSSLEELQQTVKALEERNTSLSEQLEQLKVERSNLQSRLARDTHSQEQNSEHWIWWLIGLCAVAATTFTGGIIWHRHQTVQRLGGLRL